MLAGGGNDDQTKSRKQVSIPEGGIWARWTPLSAPKKPQELLVAGAGLALGVGDEFGA